MLKLTLIISIFIATIAFGILCVNWEAINKKQDEKEYEDTNDFENV